MAYELRYFMPHEPNLSAVGVIFILLNPFYGPYPQYGWDFWEKFRKNSGKTPETLSEFFLEVPSRVRLGPPKPSNSRHLTPPEHFQNCLPLSTAGDASFAQKWFQRGPFRAGHGIPSSTEGISDSTIYLTVFHSFRKVCFCQARVAQAVPLLGALLHPETFALPPCPGAPNPTC